jgi:subtilisin family serine protease
MSVAAVDNTNTVASFSQYNSQVEIAAPGVGILSTYPMRDAAVTLNGSGFIAAALEGTVQGSASAALVDGGRCATVGSWANKTVLCERGDIAFVDKVRNAQNGGAKAVIVYNNVSGGFSGTLGTGFTSTAPAVTVSQEDGQQLMAAIGQTAYVSTVNETNASGYAYLDGTSMATPHVSGVAALVWSAKPTATNVEVRNALTSTALDLGTAGRDTSFGYGLVRAFEATDALLNGGGGTEPPATAPSALTGTKSAKGKNYTYSIRWTGGASTVDIFRGTTKIRAATSNTGSYSESSKSSSASFKVCNAGSTTECSNTLSL